jgi:transposase
MLSPDKINTPQRRLAMENISKLDFAGQPIYVGLDVHKKSWSVSILTKQSEHKTFTQPPDVAVLMNYLHRTFPGASYETVYEAGFCGFWIHDQLQAAGAQCLVVNPADIPTSDKEKRRKTNRVDCRKLAKRLRNRELTGIYVPSRERTEDRHLLRTRHGIMRKQTRCKNQIKSILAFYGIEIREDLTNWSRSFVSWIEQIALTRTSGNLTLKVHLAELLHLRTLLTQLNREIRKLATTETYRDDVMLLKTVPGIGILAAMILLTELYTIARFKSLDQLCGYVGLVPDTSSSGDQEVITGITRRRNPILRAILIEAAWVAIRKDPALMLDFAAYSKRMKKSKAIVKIARKLLNRIRFVLKNKEAYVPAIVG